MKLQILFLVQFKLLFFRQDDRFFLESLFLYSLHAQAILNHLFPMSIMFLGELIAKQIHHLIFKNLGHLIYLYFLLCEEYKILQIFLFPKQIITNLQIKLQKMNQLLL